ncbi:MAG: DNA-binding transcriptional LysR family regulator [Candidatus Azotimanducaceae bacterium]|jgi:DNA-binding transcriptional LysR family regulator
MIIEVSMDRIDSMRVFQEVARHGSFTGAAEVLGKPVQTVSKAVRQLETQLKVLLFDRTTRSVALTDTGQAYLDQCQDLLDQFDELESSVHRAHDAPKGRIRMTAPTTFGEQNLLPILASFLSLYPDIRVELSLSNRKVSLIDEGIDLAIRIGRLNDSSLIARHLAPMRKVVCAAPEFLSRHGAPDNPLELNGYPCLIDTNFEDAHHWPFSIDAETVRVEVAGPFSANTPEATRQMAVAGLGIAMCPMYVIDQDLKNGALIALFETFEPPEMGVYALYPHRRHLSTRVRALVTHLEQVFSGSD